MGGEFLQAGAKTELAWVPSEADVALVALDEREGELEETVSGEVHRGDGRKNGTVLAGENGTSGLGTDGGGA